MAFLTKSRSFTRWCECQALIADQYQPQINYAESRLGALLRSGRIG
jgi:hypothetical protein